MDEARSCCFTGHRPEKLPWGTDEHDPRCLICKEKIGQAVEEVCKQGVFHFITGMARGTDLYFAEEVLKLREEGQRARQEARTELGKLEEQIRLRLIGSPSEPPLPKIPERA